jgi:hypothetical protein
MDNSCGQTRPFKSRERGASRLKFVLVVALVAAIGYIGYQYIPVAYQASRFKMAMQDDVDKAAALGKPNEWLREKLKASANEFSVPPTAEMTIERSAEGRVQLRVQYTQPVVLPGYIYAYNFDHTVKSADLFTGK